jgi:hypothetical protein
MAFSNDYKRTINGRAVSLLSNARARCKNKNIELSITHTWVEAHLTRGTCEITGLHFCFEPPNEKATRRWDAPSLDRINKDLPYTEANTRVILWAVNCALSEYGTKIMLPILKAMVKGIESAQANRLTSVSAANHREGKDDSQPGIVLTAGTREDHYDLDHYQRTVSGEDVDYCTKTRGGDSVGHRGKEVATSTPTESEQDTWQLHPTYGWIER